MHICILSVGTRGDVQPYIALGKGLQAAGHQIQLATLGMFEPMVRSHGLGFALIEESPLSFIDRVIAPGGNFVQRVGPSPDVVSSERPQLKDNGNGHSEPARHQVANQDGHAQSNDELEVRPQVTPSVCTSGAGDGPVRCRGVNR